MSQIITNHILERKWVPPEAEVLVNWEPMALPRMYGHESLRSRLEDALASGRFPQAALLLGPAGVGKQRLALWIAQGLLCERGPGAPCGACTSCRQAAELGHPDLHWIVPIQRPKASDPDKQVDEARDLIGEAVQGRRAQRAYRPVDGMMGHPLASIRYIQRIAVLTPYRATHKVIVLGNADRLVLQEASPEAANALLKLLEEPPADTVLLLTASQPQALLPTIRSRVVPIRVGRVSDEAVRAFLLTELDPAPARSELERRVLLAEGSIGRALADDGAGSGGQHAAEHVLRAVSDGPAAWSLRALGQAPWAARGDFSTMLDALALSLRHGLEERARTGDADALRRWVTAVRRVEETRAAARGNLNPQLALAVLSKELEGLA
jgi:DNA polymerase-3 subunit delta'